jgi:hypothetical protein
VSATQVVALVGRAARTLYPHLTVGPGRGRGRLLLSRYTNGGLAEMVEVRVSDLAAAERAGRVKLHRGRWPARGRGAPGQIVLAWSPRWIPSDDALREAERTASPWPRGRR